MFGSDIHVHVGLSFLTYMCTAAKVQSSVHNLYTLVHVQRRRPPSAAAAAVAACGSHLHRFADVVSVDPTVVVFVEDAEDGHHLVLVRRRASTRQHQLGEVLEPQVACFCTVRAHAGVSECAWAHARGSG